MSAPDSKALPGGLKQEIFRDVVALGGLPFYLLVVARAAIGPYPAFLAQTALALPVIMLLSVFVRGADLHIGRALILVVFTSLFYKALPFTIFSSLVWAGMIFSLVCMKTPARGIIKGIALGAASVAISYALTLLILPG